MPLIDDNGDVHLAADTRGDGIGSLIFSTGGVERHRLKADGTGTGVFSSSQASVKYRLVSDGVTVTAYDQTGANLSSGTDGGAVLTAILPAAASNGATIDFRNDGQVFPWGSVPALPAGITNKLLIRGNGSRIKLSVAGPRAFDFAKVADGDTFQNIEITDLTVDANSIDSDVGSVLCGTWTGSNTWMKNVNFDRIAIRRVKIINVPTSSNLRPGVAFGVRNLLADPQRSITNITIEDYDQAGGIAGIIVEGVPDTDATANVKVDAIVINRWRVVRPSAPVAFVSGGQDILVGGKGFGGWCSISNGYGYGSPDVGIECDSMGTANIENVVIEDAWNAGFFHTNYKTADSTETPTINWRGCTAKRTSSLNGTWAGWKHSFNNSLPLRSVRIRDCACVSTASTIDNGTTSAIAAINFSSNTQIDSLLVDGFRVAITGWTWDASQVSLTWSALAFLNLSTSATNPAQVTLRNMRITITGTRNTGSGSNSISTGGVATSGKAKFVIDGLDWDVTITNGTAGSTRPLSVQGTSGSVDLDAARVRFVQITGDTSPQGFRIWNTAALTVNQAIKIHECDFSAGPAGTTEISYQTAGQNNDKVFAYNNTWRTKPAPTTLTGLVTATGLQLKTGYSVVVQLTPGSGSAITAVDYSTDGGSHYTNLLTQASGAMPASPTLIEVGPLTSDALIKATFTTTQPTINLVPVNP